MEKASFSIKEYVFDEVSIILSNRVSHEMEIFFDASGVFDKTESTFELTFIVNVYNKDKNIENSFVRIRCRSVFKFENINSLEEIPDFFYRNSIALLFPYVRAYISIITTQANTTGVMLPTFNLTSLESVLKAGTTEK